MLPLFTIVSLTEDMISGYRAMAAARAISLLSFFTALATGFALVAFMLRNTESDARSTTLLAVSLLTGAVGPSRARQHLLHGRHLALRPTRVRPRLTAPGLPRHRTGHLGHGLRRRPPRPPPRTLPEGENWPAASTASWCTPNVSAIPQHTTTLSAYNNTRSTSAAKHRPLRP
ncbi:hypothetical protein ID875_29435 [Streptomyces globisporus]|uniref:Uncharacterized protein n=1 Tax=Streptomyces globisporus TaxID=1908 RepID=A0A927GPM0_STRGL|nr:hypothetical protein [Streptomyces globisporus]